MEAQNFNGADVRRTFWHIIGGLCLLISVWRGFGLLELLLRQ